jgi:hypothetical protein
MESSEQSKLDEWKRKFIPAHVKKDGGEIEECLHSFSTSEPGEGDCSDLPTGRLYLRRIFLAVIQYVGPRAGSDSL